MITDITYAEVASFLNVLDRKYLEKIPKKFREIINKNKKTNYEIEYDLTKPLYEQNISREAVSIIALMHLNYWCSNEQEKKQLMQLFNDISRKKEEEKQKLYSTENLFNNRQNVETNTEIKEAANNIQMVEYKESIFKKVMNWIKNIFNK